MRLRGGTRNWIWNCCVTRHAGRFGFRLMKDTHNLGLKFRKIESEHVAAGMEDEIAIVGQQVHMAAQGLAHATLNEVAFMGVAEHFACSKADAGTRGLVSVWLQL
jgi:hypothetical protein